MIDRLSARDLRDLVAKASTIDERVAERLVPAPSPDANEARWKLWCDTLVKGDWTVFRRRLEWDGLDEATVRPLLGDVRLPDDAPLPRWAELLAAAVDAAAIDRAPPRFVDPAAPYPFEELLAPFVFVAVDRLRARAGDAYARLQECAHRTLERDLLKGLTTYAAQALHLELSIARAEALSPLDRMMIEASDDPPRAVYDDLVARMRRGGLAAFFREYAVLGRQLATIASLWIDATAELLARLDADWTALVDAFAGGAAPRAIARIEVGMSDPHAGRRTVMALDFETGARFVYKPKSVGVERAFQELLAWLDARGELLPMRTMRVLARDGYGWCEHVARAPCADRAAAERYFERAGMLLCAIYALEGVDCHRDNVIAHGEHPVLVDAEGLMQPRQRVDDMADDVLARFLAQEQLSHSVLRTGMLPHFQVRGEGNQKKVYDISALGGFHDGEEEVRRLAWTHANTDAMDLGVRTVKFRVSESGPSLDGRALGLADHRADVERGFRAMYAALVRHRDRLLAEDGPLARLAREPVRFIFRDTQTYGLLGQRLLDPELQRDGVLRAIQLDLLCRPHIPPAAMLDKQKEAPSWWAVFGAELRAMQSEDIPFFGARPTANALVIPRAHDAADRAAARELPGLFEGTSYDVVVDRVRALGPDDLERQVSYIGASLYGLGAPATDAVPPPPEVTRLPSDDDLLDEVRSIAEQIARSAVRAKDVATWVAPQFVFRSERYLLYSLQNDLYTGLGGVALFLAAAGRACGAPELEALARDTVRPLRREIATRGAKLADTMGIGGATGVGSIVYYLTHMARTLGDASLLDDARSAAALVTPERIAADATYDVCDGVAGAILGLAPLYEATGDARVLDAARACGDHLARAAVPAGDGAIGWITILDKVMVGFSHGVAGIALALLRLHRATGDEAWRTLARRAIAYEDSLFSDEHQNWPDLRGEIGTRYSASWCHGAPGITLGRLGGLASLDDDAVRRGIERGIAQTLARACYPVDYACCGNVGLVDVLVTAARRLDRPALRDAALRRAWQVVTRARARGAYALDPVLPRQMLNPSFYQGVAGIGYTLLRLARPEPPSVLAWE